MAGVSDQLIWELVKKNSKFLVKQFGNSKASIQFSSEPNNLYNLNTYKHSGLANKKTVSITSAGDGIAVVLGTTKTKKVSKPAEGVNKSVLRRDFRQMVKVVENQVAENGYRPDLKAAAFAKLSCVHKSLRVAKARKTKKVPKSSRKSSRS